MKRIAEAAERLKKVHKNDIITFFETLLGDKNIEYANPETRISISQAYYKRNKARLTEDEQETVETEKVLTIRFSANKPKKAFFEFVLVRDGNFTILHRSLSIYWKKQ